MLHEDKAKPHALVQQPVGLEPVDAVCVCAWTARLLDRGVAIFGHAHPQRVGQRATGDKLDPAGELGAKVESKRARADDLHRFSLEESVDTPSKAARGVSVDDHRLHSVHLDAVERSRAWPGNVDQWVRREMAAKLCRLVR